MPHRNTVAYRYSIKLERRPARPSNSLLNARRHLIQVNMPRDNLAETVGYSDKRLAYILAAEAASMKKTPVRGPLKAFFNRIASHNPGAPKTLANSLQNAKIVF
jgi:hypothetical protein